MSRVDLSLGGMRSCRRRRLDRTVPRDACGDFQERKHRAALQEMLQPSCLSRPMGVRREDGLGMKGRHTRHSQVLNYGEMSPME